MALINYPIASTALARIDYDDEEQTCYFTFLKGGRSYIIEGIAQIEVERWANAPSVGQYWNYFVKGKY